MDLVNTYEKIFETVLHNYTCDDVELNLLHFEFPVHAKKAELLTNIQKFVDGHGATYISGTVAEPGLSDFEDDFHGNFSEFLTRCFKDRIDWYRISQNEELGKFPHGGVFGEKLELIV